MIGPEIIQGATEAAQAGRSSLFLDAGMVTLIVTNAGLIIKEWLRTRKVKKDNGSSKPCLDHDRRLTIVEQGQKHTDEKIDQLRRENREDHKQIFEALDKQK